MELRKNKNYLFYPPKQNPKISYYKILKSTTSELSLSDFKFQPQNIIVLITGSLIAQQI